MSAGTSERDEVLAAMWQKWQRFRAQEKLAWAADEESDAHGRRFELSAAVRNLSDLIVSLHPHSATGLVVQLRILSTVLCQTPSEHLEYADTEEKWFRSILAGAELLVDDRLPPWNVDEDARCAELDE